MAFSTPAARTAARATITSAISGRDITVERDEDRTWRSNSWVMWEATSNSTGDMGIVYALIAGLTTPVTLSQVLHHTCFHGDNTNLCVPTARKVW